MGRPRSKGTVKKAEEGQRLPDASSGAGRRLEPVGVLSVQNEHPPTWLAFPRRLQLPAGTWGHACPGCNVTYAWLASLAGAGRLFRRPRAVRGSSL